MKKILILIPALVLLIITPGVFAKEKEKETKVVTLPAGEVINKDYFAIGDIVEISGTVNGDVYAFASQIIVDGTVNGDLIASGGVVTISGRVSQDLRIAGGQLTISGDIGRNVTIAGGNIEFTADAIVRGSILAGSGNMTLAAPVGSNIKIGAGNLTISNKINGDVEAGVGTMRLTSKAVVSGNITYWSKNKASIDENAVISGDITIKAPPEFSAPISGNIFGGFTAFYIIATIVGFISTFLIGFLMIKLFPNLMKNTTTTIESKPWISLGVGFIGLIVTPIIALFLIISIIGFPIGLILGTLFLISTYLSRIFFIFFIGTFILSRLNKNPHIIWSFIIGLLIYYTLTLIPIVGSLVTFLSVAIGFGSLLITKKVIYSEVRKNKII